MSETKTTKRRREPWMGAPEVKAQLAALGVTQLTLARESGISQSNLSMLLNGRLAYMGPSRAARLQDALHRLALEAAAKAEAAQATEGDGAPPAPRREPRVRRL